VFQVEVATSTGKARRRGWNGGSVWASASASAWGGDDGDDEWVREAVVVFPRWKFLLGMGSAGGS
jgi:hypothetical protein